MEKDEIELINREHSINLTGKDIENLANKVFFRSFKKKDRIRITFKEGHSMRFDLSKSYRNNPDFKAIFEAVEKRLNLKIDSS